MKIKFKIGALWLLGIVIMASMPVSTIAYGAGTDPNMEIRFNTNEHLSGERTVPIMLAKGKILVPLRQYASALGFAISYSSKTKQTTVSSPKTTIIVQAGSKLATVNGKKRTMPMPLTTVRGSSWISLDWIAEVFPAKIDGRYLTLEENYYRTKTDKDELILNAQSGDIYLSVAGGAPRKVGTVHPKLSIGGLYAEKTANGNYYVEANEVWGDTASSMSSNTTALYIWNRQVLLQATMDESIKSVRQYKDRVFFMKDGKTLVIDDQTGRADAPGDPRLRAIGRTGQRMGGKHVLILSRDGRVAVDRRLIGRERTAGCSGGRRMRSRALPSPDLVRGKERR